MKDTLRILLIDDHQTVLWGLEQLINSQHPRMQVIGTATNPSDALEKAKLHKPDLILLDLFLGKEMSLPLLPKLKACCEAQILLLTGAHDAQALDDAILQGARGVIHKEEAVERLLEAIEKVSSGQIWLDRESTARVFDAMIHKELQPNPEQKKITLLTEKEKTVIRELVADPGSPNKILAERLFMSEHTLRNHLTSIYQKLQVDNRLALYAYATRNGFNREDN